MKSPQPQYTRKPKIIIEIQCCNNCNSHRFICKHQQNKYVGMLELVRNRLEVEGWAVRKRIIPEGLYRKTPYCPQTVYCDSSNNNLVFFPRVGAFEVFLKGKLIFSRLEEKKWPQVEEIVRNIRDSLEKQQNSPAREEQNSNFIHSENIKKIVMNYLNHHRGRYRLSHKDLIKRQGGKSADRSFIQVNNNFMHSKSKLNARKSDLRSRIKSYRESYKNSSNFMGELLRFNNEEEAKHKERGPINKMREGKGKTEMSGRQQSQKQVKRVRPRVKFNRFAQLTQDTKKDIGIEQLSKSITYRQTNYRKSKLKVQTGSRETSQQPKDLFYHWESPQPQVLPDTCAQDIRKQEIAEDVIEQISMVIEVSEGKSIFRKEVNQNTSKFIQSQIQSHIQSQLEDRQKEKEPGQSEISLKKIQIPPLLFQAQYLRKIMNPAPKVNLNEKVYVNISERNMSQKLLIQKIEPDINKQQLIL